MDLNSPLVYNIRRSLTVAANPPPGTSLTVFQASFDLREPRDLMLLKASVDYSKVAALGAQELCGVKFSLSNIGNVAQPIFDEPLNFQIGGSYTTGVQTVDLNSMRFSQADNSREIRWIPPCAIRLRAERYEAFLTAQQFGGGNFAVGDVVIGTCQIIFR